ncbi:MAG TPA: hypothetical protein VGN34_13920, partial [Ktedonobacteraceae bacterium]
IQLLLDLMRREDITANDTIEVARILYSLSSQGTPEQQETIQTMLMLAKRRDIPFRDTVEAAHALYVESPRGSQERQQAVEMLLTQARWPDTTAAQAQEAILALCYASSYRSKENQQGIQVLIELTRRPGLTFEDVIILENDHNILYTLKALKQQLLVAKKQMWEILMRRTDLTPEQRTQATNTLADYKQWE